MDRCSYPVSNPLAVRARPTRCGEPAGILTGVPYPGESGEEMIVFQSTCLKHAAEVASWRLLASLPREQFSSEEIEMLVSSGVSREQLMLELIRLRKFISPEGIDA